MNTQIKRLLEQSGLQPYYDSQQGDIEKFAELLVKECAEIALLDGQLTGNFEVFNKITKHFGVAE